VCVRVPSVGCVAEWLTDKPVNCVWSSRDVVVTARAPSRTCCPLMVVTVACQRDAIYYSAPDRGARSIVMSVSVCLSLSLCLRVCLSVHDHISRTTRRSSLIFLCMLPVVGPLWRLSDTLRISGFVDDVIFAQKQTGCSTSPPG